MAAKEIEVVADTAQTLYVVIRREADGYFLDDADGSFAASPADYFLSVSEHATVKGFYSVSESRIAWNDGEYAIIPYIQTGGSPSIADDIPGTAEKMAVRGDVEVTLATVNNVVNFLSASIVGMRKLFTDVSAQMAEVLKQIRLLLAQILDLEKKIRREPNK